MNDVTRILSAIEHGDPQAAERLLPLVYDELRKLAARRLMREKAGHTLQSETDTECVAHLVEERYQGNLAEAVRATLGELTGAYALVVTVTDEPGVIVGSKVSSPEGRWARCSMIFLYRACGNNSAHFDQWPQLSRRICFSSRS